MHHPNPFQASHSPKPQANLKGGKLHQCHIKYHEGSNELQVPSFWLIQHTVKSLICTVTWLVLPVSRPSLLSLPFSSHSFPTLQLTFQHQWPHIWHDCLSAFDSRTHDVKYFKGTFSKPRHGRRTATTLPWTWNVKPHYKYQIKWKR